MRNTVIAAVVAASAFGANAQQLQTEITIDRTIQPEVREALRLNGPSPVISLPEVPAARLDAAEYTDAGTLTIDLGELPAARWADSVAHTPYRGYAMLGYFPTFNLGANAGYRVIDNSRANAGVWMQYTGVSYKDDLPYCADAAFNRNYVSVGANGSYRFDRYSLLSASADYTYSAVSHPYALNSYTQSANELNINAAWRSAINKIAYNASLSFGHFAFPDDITGMRFNAIDQRTVNLTAGIGLSDTKGERPWIGIDIDWRWLHTNDYLPGVGIGSGSDPRPTVNLGQAHFHPYFRTTLDKVGLRLGFNLSVGHGNGESKLKFAPEVQLDYGGSGMFSVFARLSGGQYLNLMSDLYARNPYVFAYRSYGRSNIPVRLDAGFTLIPANGFKVNVKGGYAIARDYLTPVVYHPDEASRESFFMPDAVNSWHLSAVVEYSLRSLLKVSLEGAIGGADNDWSSWMEWADASKCRTAIKATLTPLEPLAVDLSYGIATGRKIRDFEDNPTNIYSLGVARSLDLGASWVINPQFTVFLRVENLLNAHCLLTSLTPAQGIHGLAGISAKF